ncbi:MAG: hypothetical protein HOP21_03860 [Methylotenera sp.]|nr:hypothetical protein [Methylotenera sp.]
MFKALFNKILANTSAHVEEATPAFKITENPNKKSDFEVTELSYEEYARFLSQDRQKTTKPSFEERRKVRMPVDVDRRRYAQGAHA